MAVEMAQLVKCLLRSLIRSRTRECMFFIIVLGRWEDL